MNLTKYVPTAISQRAGRQLLITKKHSPTLLFVVGVTGMVATTVIACRATLKLEEVVEDIERSSRVAKELRHSSAVQYSEEDYENDMLTIRIRTIARVGQLYAPAFGMGVLSVAALTGAHNILSKRNLALTAAYKAIEAGFNEYRRRVVDEFGEEKDQEFRYSAETKTIVEEQPSGQMKKVEVKRVGPNGASIYARFFDQMSQSWQNTPQYNLIFLHCQQQWANDMLRARGHVFLNEVYDALDIPRTVEGSVVGWLWNKGTGDDCIDFGIFEGNTQKARDFVNGHEGSILLDFNVDGLIYDKI